MSVDEAVHVPCGLHLVSVGPARIQRIVMFETVEEREHGSGKAEKNSLELLLFRLAGVQRFGINVFKVQEVFHCPPLTQLPGAHPVVRGIASMRGNTIPVIDLSMAIGGPSLEDIAERFVILTEYNRKIQGFLVGSVDRIVHLSWKEILPPPKGTGGDCYMTAVTRVENELIQIIDVEKVLDEIIGRHDKVADNMTSPNISTEPRHVLVVDDSSVARSQVKRVLDQIGISTILCNNGRQALDQLQAWSREGRPVNEFLSLVISDVEMPQMDGYTLTEEIKKDRALAVLPVVLHTSLSGEYNATLAQQAGADEFLAKFEPNELAAMVQRRIHSGDREALT